MFITIRGIEKHVQMINDSGDTWTYSVGKAKATKSKTQTVPFVRIPGKTFPQFKKYVPLIHEFVLEYKRLVAIPSTPAPLSIVGETPDSVYRYQKQDPKKNYVSSVPKWITEMKEWKVCSGPHRTYKRRVRLPLESKELAEKYLPFCCSCHYRVDCNQACAAPETFSEVELIIS